MITKRFPRGLYAPEALEARIAPATITVTSLLDNGGGADLTLREAIVQANGTAASDTIVFAPSLFLLGPGTITLAGATDLDITTTLTIKGPGVDKLTISGANASRIFNIDDLNANPAVLHPTSISGLTLLDGNAGALYGGGAIFSKEPLTLKRVVIASSVSGEFGGGLYAVTTGKVVITDSKFIDNTSTNQGGGGAYVRGGAGVVVTRTLVSGNSAGGWGGGMYLSSRGRGTVIVDGCAFVGNTATRGGGALELFSEDLGRIIVKNSTFTGNTSGRGGGALYLEGGNFLIQSNTFTRNSAGAGAGGGGAIGSDGPVSTVITGSRFDGNTTAENGGALDFDTGRVSVSSSIFTGNQSTKSGGAVQAGDNVILTIARSTFSGNQATINGGAIHVQGTDLRLNSSVLSGNAAVDGGGLSAELGAKVAVSRGSFLGNSASSDGGGIATIGTAANAVNLTVSGTLFQGNRAGNGGAVDTDGDGTVLIKSARVLGNQAASFGGGMYLRSSTSVIIQGSLFQYNVAGTGDGGGLAFDLNSATAVGTVTASKFLDNFAGDDSGGIAAFGSATAVLTLKNSVISGNVAATQAGGMRISSPIVTRIATVISGNWAPTSPNIFP